MAVMPANLKLIYIYNLNCKCILNLQFKLNYKHWACCTRQSHKSPSAVQSSSKKPFQGRRLYMCPSHPSWGRLPVDQAGDTGTVLFGYQPITAVAATETYWYDHNLPSVYSNSFDEVSCSIYFMNSQALGPGLVRQPLQLIKCKVCDLCYCYHITLLSHSSYFYIVNAHY